MAKALAMVAGPAGSLDLGWEVLKTFRRWSILEEVRGHVEL